MELKTQALDRVLEALSPALAAEIDRIVAETCQALEQDFQERLQSAVRDAEANFIVSAEAQLIRAVADAKETTRKQVTEELEELFRAKLADTATQLQSEASGERARLQEQLDRWRIFAETQRELAEVSSQPEMLARFLVLAQPFAAGLGLYVAKPDGLALWKSRGQGVFPEIISDETTDPQSYFRTIEVRGKSIAAVCGVPPFQADALDFLTSSLQYAIEVFGLKMWSPAPKPAVTSQANTVPRAPTASGEAPVDPKAQADARRTARLLVSEIKLYHERELKEGREHSDIYRRLQKEIDLGREAYKRRVPPPMLVAHDYFHEELIRILTENDPSRMGAGYPGPLNSKDV
jgi:hypothetical protein